MNDKIVSWSKTKKNIENITNKYNLYIISVSTPQDNVDENYNYRLLNSSDLKNNYIKISDESFEERVEFINYVRYSYNKLTSDERKIVYWTYFDKENNYDDRFIANNLGFSLGYYYMKKKEALIRFAFSLGVEEI